MKSDPGKKKLICNLKNRIMSYLIDWDMPETEWGSNTCHHNRQENQVNYSLDIIDRIRLLHEYFMLVA